MAYDEWVLIAEGKDIYGNVRRYMEEGKGNKDIDFKGKTNDAINAENDMYFADGEVKITLTSKKSGESSGGRLFIDNTPPEVIVNNVSVSGASAVIEGSVTDKFPDNEKLTKNDSAVSGLDETSMPRNVSMYEKNVSLDISNQYFNDKLSSIFKGNLSDIEGLNDETSASFKDEIENTAGAIMEDAVEDKVGNVAPSINFNFQADMNDKEVEPLFQTQGFNVKLDNPTAVRVVSNAKRFKPNIPIWKKAPYVGILINSFDVGLQTGTGIMRKMQDKCLERINSEPVNVGVVNKYEIGDLPPKKQTRSIGV